MTTPNQETTDRLAQVAAEHAKSHDTGVVGQQKPNPDQPAGTPGIYRTPADPADKPTPDVPGSQGSVDGSHLDAKQNTTLHSTENAAYAQAIPASEADQAEAATADKDRR